MILSSSPRERAMDKKNINSIIHRAIVCRLAMSLDNIPYIVPLCFGYDGKNLYFHSAAAGKKIETLGKNGNVCFEFDIDQEVVSAKKPCSWSMKYKSVIGQGVATFIEDIKSKTKALSIIMKQYTDKPYEFLPQAVDKTKIIKVEIQSISGKEA